MGVTAEDDLSARLPVPKQARRLHPLVHRALGLFVQGDKGELALGQDAVPELARALKAYSDERELIKAVEALLDLGCALGEEGALEAAVLILKVAAGAREALAALGGRSRRARDTVEKLDGAIARVAKAAHTGPRTAAALARPAGRTICRQKQKRSTNEVPEPDEELIKGK